MIAARYTRVAIALHWAMALALGGMLISGLLMTADLLPKPLTFQLYQLHKATGVVLLLAVLVRLAWRVMHPPPALPDTIPAIEKTLAVLGHLALYALMIAIPLAGWVIVSASVYGLPTSIYGLFNWPHLPGLAGNTQVGGWAAFIHEMLAFGLIGLVGLHVLAVAKHAIKDRVNLLRRMGMGVVAGLAMGAATLMVPLTAQAQSHAVDPAHSYLNFAGEHAGTPFAGRFSTWDASIDFDPNAPGQTTLTVTIDLASAHTGNAQYDGTLPTKDWFDVSRTPKAQFVARSFTPRGDNIFVVTGDLSLRGVTRPVAFDTRLDNPDGNPVTASGSFVINRLDFGIGAQSDGSADWVADAIRIDFSVRAMPITPVP